MTIRQPLTAPPPRPVLSSTVLAVVLRVAGPVLTEVRPHAIGHPEQQVSISRRSGCLTGSPRPGWPPGPAPTPSVSPTG